MSAGEVPTEPTTKPLAGQRRYSSEIAIVLALSLGQSAVYAWVSLVATLTANRLVDQRTTLNPSVTPRPWLDLTYQLLGIMFALAPVALVCWLLTYLPGRGYTSNARDRLGLRPRPWADLRNGLLLAAVIGLPGLGLYFAGRALGITVQIVPTGLADTWWTMGILVLQALKNALLEEIIVVGYLITRLRQCGLRTRWALAISAALRACYHLYQGIGPAIGNAVMGVVFAGYFARTQRVLPLIVAHAVIDIVAFVGYAVATAHGITIS